MKKRLRILNRSTLTRNIEKMQSKVGTTLLPVDVLKIFVHGSYFRGDKMPGDLDVFILVEVKDGWANFCHSFRTLYECHDKINECLKKKMKFSDAINSLLFPEIEKRNLPREWLASATWGDIINCEVPSWDKITRQMLTRGTKGVHIELLTTSEPFELKIGRLYTYHDMPAFLVWSHECPETFVLKPTSEEFATYLTLESERLKKDLADAKFIVAVGETIIREILTMIPEDKLGLVSVQIFNNTAKYQADEACLRAELKKFGLPEFMVFPIKRRGSKVWYDLAENETERKDLERRVKDNDKRNLAERTILRLLRKLILKSEASNIDCTVRKIENGSAEIYVYMPPTMSEETFRKIWEPRGFTIENWFRTVSAERDLEIPLSSNESEIMSVLKQVCG